MQVAKAYLELEGVLFILQILWDGQAVAIVLAGDWLAGTIYAGTLGSAGEYVKGIMVGVSVGVDGIDLVMIYCKALIAQSWSSPMENVNNKDGFFTASSRYSIAQRAASVEGKIGTGQLCGKNLIVLPLSQSKVWVNTPYSIISDHDQGQGTKTPLHDGQRYVDNLV